MNSTKKNLSTPYPTQGEILRALAGALGTKARNQDLDRFAREGDFDCSLRDKLMDEIITEPLGKYLDKEFALFTRERVSYVLDGYLELVTHVALDGLSREQALPLLIEHFFSRHAVGLLFSVLENGPLPHLMVSDNEVAVDVVFKWLETLDAEKFRGLMGELGKEKQTQIAKWRNKSDIPALQSIFDFGKSVRKAFSDNVARDMKQYLLVARAIDRFATKHTELWTAAKMPERVWSPQQEYSDVGRVLWSGQQKHLGQRLEPLLKAGVTLVAQLQRDSEKSETAREAARKAINEAREIQKELDPDGLASYFIDWHEARWHVFSGELGNALKCYQQAFESSLYRAGKNQLEIIKEALVVAAKQADRPFLKRLKNQAVRSFLKRLKNQAITFRMFVPQDERDPFSVNNKKSKDHIVDDWEVIQWARQFEAMFPPVGWFAGTDIPDSGNSWPVILGWNEEQKRKLDLKQPDRKITVGRNGGVRYPQLVWFLVKRQLEHVESLLKAGASVDVHSASGDTPILVAVQNMNPSCGPVDRRYFDLISAKPHKLETVNMRTSKRKLTPLTCAIETGEPDVVRKLLEMGAEVDRRGLDGNLTSLYYCVQTLHQRRDPAGSMQKMLEHGKRPTPELLDTLRRYSGGMAGIDAEQQAGFLRRLNEMSNPRHEAIKGELLDYFAGQLTLLEIPKLLEIAEILLQAGADPNAPHKIGTLQDYTPLMLAAEFDEAELFQKMLAHGGKPEQECFQGGKHLDCWKIALGWGSKNVVEILRNRDNTAQTN